MTTLSLAGLRRDLDCQPQGVRTLRYKAVMTGVDADGEFIWTQVPHLYWRDANGSHDERLHTTEQQAIAAVAAALEKAK